MKNKRKLIKIIVILSLLICVLCVKIYFDMQKRNNIKIDDEYQNSNINPSESDKLDIDLLTNNVFVIDSIEKKDNKYKLTVYLLEESGLLIPKEECACIRSRKELFFRNTYWRYVLDSVMGEIITQTNNDNIHLKLSINNTDEACFLENIAGEKSSLLRDYSKKKLIFEVDDDLLIGTSNIKIVKDNKNSLKIVSEEEISKEMLPTILKYQELISSGETMGSYGECNAIVINNKVVAINTNIK